MTLREFYDFVKGDYEDVMERMASEALVKRFLLMFTETEEYTDMLKAVEAKDWERGFRLSHNLKGIGLNLGLRDFYNSASTLCDTMRHGAPTEDISNLVEAVRSNYEFAVAAIKRLD